MCTPLRDGFHVIWVAFFCGKHSSPDTVANIVYFILRNFVDYVLPIRMSFACMLMLLLMGSKVASFQVSEHLNIYSSLGCTTT
jgi:hypothetical protein